MMVAASLELGIVSILNSPNIAHYKFRSYYLYA